MQLIPHRSPLFPYTTLFRSCLPLTAPSSPRSPANRAASRDSADAPLRGRLEGPVVRPPRSPDHSRGARVHPYRLAARSEEHTSELQSHSDLVCRLLLEKKKQQVNT